MLFGVIQDAAGRVLPLKKVLRKKVVCINKNVWFDAECRKLKRFIDKMAKRFYKSPTNENKSSLAD